MLRRVELAAAAARIRGGGGGGSSSSSSSGKKIRQERRSRSTQLERGKVSFVFPRKRVKEGEERRKTVFFKCGISRSSVFESNVRLNFDKCWGKKSRCCPGVMR